MGPENMRSVFAMLAWAMGLAGVALVGRAADPAAGGSAAPTEPVRAVVQFLSIDYRDANQWMYVGPPGGGVPRRLLMSEEVRRAFRGERPGGLIWVTTKVGVTGIEMVTEASAYDGPRELTSPKAFVFDGLGEEKSGKSSQVVVKLSKFGQTLTAVLPAKPGAGRTGAVAGLADALLERLRALAVGDVIEIEAQRQGDTLVLLDVDKYREPVFAELVRTGTVNLAGKATAGVILEVGEEQKTYALPAPSAIYPPAAALAAEVNRLKGGAYVWYTARDETTPPTLRDIRPDVQIRPRGADDMDVIATFCRVRLTSRGTSWTSCEVVADNNRPEDRILDAGCRRLISDVLEAEKAGMNSSQIERLKALVSLNPAPGGDFGGFGRRWRNRGNNGNENLPVTQRERDQFAQVYRQFLQAEDPAMRKEIEQRIIWATVELSGRFRKEADLNLVTIKGMLSPGQLEAAMRLGEEEVARPGR